MDTFRGMSRNSTDDAPDPTDWGSTPYAEALDCTVYPVMGLPPLFVAFTAQVTLTVLAMGEDAHTAVGGGGTPVPGTAGRLRANGPEPAVLVAFTANTYGTSMREANVVEQQGSLSCGGVSSPNSLHTHTLYVSKGSSSR